MSSMGTVGKSCASCGGHYGSEVLFCPLDGTPLSSSRTLTASPNEIDPYLFLELPGQIRLNALVGIGSMGRVYRAFQSGVDRDVAVKILHRELTGNQELVGRFHREAKIASRLVHPNVVQVLMTGTLPQAADLRTGGEVYLVMEYLDGISLLSALHAQGEGGALPLARTLHIVLQLCDAVGEAHANNIVHRDLKPENIMLVRRGEDPDFSKVLDFGIARLDSALEGSTTQAGLIFGTAKYISPEGAEGKHVGPQADVYAIATIVYQCLAGRTPFQGDSPMALLVQQIHGTPTDLRTVPRASYVPESIARLVMGNLSKDPDQRCENARMFGRELSLAARDAGLHLDTMHGGAPRGDLRLLSKQRTRQHEFSAELKAKIASMPSTSVGRGTNGYTNGSNGQRVLSRPITAYEESPGAGLLNGSRVVPPSPPRPSQPGTGTHEGPGFTQHGELDDLSADTNNGDVSASEIEAALSTPGHTQMSPEDATINGSLDQVDENGAPMSVQHLRQNGMLARPGPTIAGEPITDAPLSKGARRISPTQVPDGSKSTPPEDHVEGPISSNPSPRASHPGPQPSTPAPRPSNPGIAPPSRSQPGVDARRSVPARASQPAISIVESTPPRAPSSNSGIIVPSSKPSPVPRSVPAPAPSSNPAASKQPPPLPATSAAAKKIEPSREPTLVEEPVVRPRIPSDDPPDEDVRPARPVTWRTFALIASLLVVVPVGAYAAAKIFGAQAQDRDSFDARIEAAQEAMEKRAWDAPPGANVKDLTDKLLAESPGDRRVIGIRTTASERIVNDGLRKKSAGDAAEALRLFQLALDLTPGLDTARDQILDLEQSGTSASGTATATVTSPPVPTPASTETAPTATSTPSSAASSSPSMSSSTKPSASTTRPGTASTGQRPTSTSDGIEIPPIPDLTPTPTATTSGGGWM